MNQQKVIIDTDPGVDDAMAIIYAHLEPEIDLLGLTSIFGNVTIDIATRNTLALAEMLDSRAAVAPGARQPLVQAPKDVAWEVHGREGFGDVPPISPGRQADSRSASVFICDMVNLYPGEVVLCPVGPLTNIALALEHDPSIAERVKSVVVMGGSLDEGGNVTEYAEANIWQDPHAADKVFAASWPVTMIGLDVTHQVICSPEDFAALATASPRLGGFLNDAAQFYFDFHARVDGIRGCHMHDPTAVISIVRSQWFSTEVVPIETVVDGTEVGKTVRSPDASRSAVNAAMGIDSEAVKQHFLNTIKSGD